MRHPLGRINPRLRLGASCDDAMEKSNTKNAGKTGAMLSRSIAREDFGRENKQVLVKKALDSTNMHLSLGAFGFPFFGCT